jgi:predicted nucleic acid-binding protein
VSEPVVCDTTVWLYLGRVDQLELLPTFYSTIYTTESVCRELDAGRVTRREMVDPRLLEWATVVESTEVQLNVLPESQLGAGELSVMAYAIAHGIQVVGIDDRQARLFAQRLRLHVIGTLGILLRAKRHGIVPALKPLLEQLTRERFYLSQELLEYVLHEAGEL